MVSAATSTVVASGVASPESGATTSQLGWCSVIASAPGGAFTSPATPIDDVAASAGSAMRDGAMYTEVAPAAATVRPAPLLSAMTSTWPFPETGATCAGASTRPSTPGGVTYTSTLRENCAAATGTSDGTKPGAVTVRSAA